MRSVRHVCFEKNSWHIWSVEFRPEICDLFVALTIYINCAKIGNMVVHAYVCEQIREPPPSRCSYEHYVTM